MGAGKSSLGHTFNSHPIAATVSLAVARLFGLAEAYWAAIVTLVVMQSTLGATLLISIERIAATALGALAGALVAGYFPGNLLVFAAVVFVLGLLCGAFRMEKIASRYAGVTLAMIVLIPRSNVAWIVALHRFFEVSVGILVALAVVAVCRSLNPNPQNKTPNNLRVVLAHALRSRTNSRSRFVSADPKYARIVGPARNELGKFRRMQNSCENFQAVDNARARAREVCAGIYGIQLAATHSGNRTKTGKSPEQFVIAARSLNVVSAKRKHDNLWTRIQDLLPIDLRRRLMLSA